MRGRVRVIQEKDLSCIRKGISYNFVEAAAVARRSFTAAVTVSVSVTVTAAATTAIAFCFLVELQAVRHFAKVEVISGNM